MADLIYIYEGNLYANLTNRCPCSCTFCVRTQTDGLGTAESLWLQRDPTFDEVVADLQRYDLSRFDQLVYCGYGEPLCALDTLVQVSAYLREHSRLKLRVNTNGLGDLIHGKPTVPILAGAVDAVSISLNAPDAARYNEVTRPSFGEPAFDAMLRYAKDCKAAIPEVQLSVVDVIAPEEVAQCRALAQKLGIPLRVRHFVAADA